MHMDIVDLRQFYASPLGQQTERSITSALTALWKPISDERLVGFGFANRYLDRFRGDAERTISLMPASQGAVQWPSLEPSSTALVAEEDLPLADASVDRVLLVHALEHSANAQEALSEIWRILSPGGRLIIVVPNRRGVWARMDQSPFGAGRPYSTGQLSRLLKENMFTPTAWSEALFFPPTANKLIMKFASGLERFGRKYTLFFAGVIVVEATKHLYQGLPIRQRQSRRIFVPVLAPQGVTKDTIPK